MGSEAYETSGISEAAYIIHISSEEFESEQDYMINRDEI
jgi:hypothetical protein